MHSSTLGLLGTIMQFVAVILSVVLGFKEQLAALSIIICGLILETAYVLIRLPQIIGIWQEDGIRIGILFFFQLFINIAIAAVFYGIGLGLSRILS